VVEDGVEDHLLLTTEDQQDLAAEVLEELQVQENQRQQQEQLILVVVEVDLVNVIRLRQDNQVDQV
tara:strand:- start:119 stop:316 length:198 start_codon:yes stop_codon:yes gene_type:complete